MDIGRLLGKKVLGFLVILNLIWSGLLTWKSISHSARTSPEEMEHIIQEIAEKNPEFFASLMNQSAEHMDLHNQEMLANRVFLKKDEILNHGIVLKNQPNANKTLVLFADASCANCLAYLHNIKTALSNLNCSVRLIFFAMYGDKANNQAKLIWAASLQNPEKALEFALAYDTTIDAQNNTETEALKLGLDFKKINTDLALQSVLDEINVQNKIAEQLEIGAPSIFLLTPDKAYILPPTEAAEIPKLVEHPSTALIDIG